MSELMDMSALALGAAVKRRALRPIEAVRASLEAISAKNREVNAVITPMAARAERAAISVEHRMRGGEVLSSLAGVPIILKDNISVGGVRMTCGSRMLEDYVAAYDAAVTGLLERAGLIIVAKANLDEFAMGATGETSAFGAVRLPGNPGRAAGGSSSGSAAALAAKMSPLALGSDTGGSVRLPASWCGVYGLKPTYGAVSRYGLVQHASSLDCIGPMARTAADTAALFGVISGRDARDMTSSGAAGSNGPPGDVGGLRIAVPEQLLAGCAPDILNCLDRLAGRLRDMGAETETVSIPELAYAPPAYQAISCAEASSNLGRYDGMRYGLKGEGSSFDEHVTDSRSRGFGYEVKRRILLGTYVLSGGNHGNIYLKAKEAARQVKSGMEDMLRRYDVLLGPTAKGTAPPLGAAGEKGVADSNTVAASLAGLPALSFPCGTDSGGLPVGAQLIGRKNSEYLLLGVAGSLEEAGIW